MNELLAQTEAAGTHADTPRPLLIDAIRTVLDRARDAHGTEPQGGWLEAVRAELTRAMTSTLTRVVNATGVVLHTNLGRAPLPAAARSAMEDALGYCTLEFDRVEGARSSRQQHVRDHLRAVTGAEDGLAVTNAAAALVLVLNTLAEGGETIVSRGELVEIGGAFRIPDILQKSGSALVEVGTTNRTRSRDYQLAISPRTKALLKVHRSNFELRGFVEDVSIEDLVALAAPHDMPTVHDIGSGLLVDLEPYGLTGEPLVQTSVAAGALVVFSGDKLVGGPQSGLIVGRAEHVARLAANPLARAFRHDKLTLAALDATLRLYRAETAIREIPVLAMLTATPADLERRAAVLAAQLPAAELRSGTSAVGGGAFPEADLPTTLVSLKVGSPDQFLAALRAADPPVVARSGDGVVLLDVRTIADRDFSAVSSAVRSATA